MAVSTPSLAAGASTTVQGSFTISNAGTYYAHVYADNDSLLPLSTAGNDKANSSAITVASAGQQTATFTVTSTTTAAWRARSTSG